MRLRVEEGRRSDLRVAKLIDRTMVRLWETIDELEQLTPPELSYYRVAIFGSARVQPGDLVYRNVRQLAAKVTDMGCDIVTGGGPGLMEAANEGARDKSDGKTRSFGLAIVLPREQETNPYVDKVTLHRTFFSRLHHFVRMSHAFVICPGGIGTALETFIVWQLLQVKFIEGRPLIFFGQMWKGLIEWMRQDMLSRHTIDESDLHIPVCTDSIDEAVEIIRKSREKFEADRAAILQRQAELPAGQVIS